MPKRTPTQAKMTQATFQGDSQRVPVTIEINGLSDDGSTHFIYIHAPHTKQNFRRTTRSAKEDFRERVTQLLESIESDDFMPEGWKENTELSE